MPRLKEIWPPGRRTPLAQSNRILAATTKLEKRWDETPSEQVRQQRFRELRPLDPGLPYGMRDPELPSSTESRPGHHSNGVVMPPLRGSTPQDLNLAKLEYLWTALDKLESYMEANDRRLETLERLRPPARQPSGWDSPAHCAARRYSAYDQPRRSTPQRPHHLHQSHYQRSQYRPARQPYCWDKPQARTPMSSLTDEVSESTYYSNNDWDFDDYEESTSDSDGYDEDFDVGYSRQPYHQLHSRMPQRPPYFTRESYVQSQSSKPYSDRHTTHSNGQPWHKDRLLLPRSTSCFHPTTQLRQAAACLEQPAAEQQPLVDRPPSCQRPLSGTTDEDFRGGRKRVDEDLCNETELIPVQHSSSLDQELDAHHKMKKNNTLNWVCSFLDEVDESKSSILDDDYDDNKATFDDDEIIEMEHQSVTKCFGSDDEDEVDGVDVLSQHQNLVQQMTVELKSCDIRCLPAICENLIMLPERQSIIEKMEILGLVEEGKATLKMQKHHLEGEMEEKRELFEDKIRVKTEKLVTKKTAISNTMKILKKRGRRTITRCAFDPGGDPSPWLRLTTLCIASWFPP